MPEETATSPAQFGLPEKVVELLRDDWGISSFHPPQLAALPHALEGKSLMLAAPTASGKTLVAQLAIVKKLIEVEPGSRAVYIVPLKALASEKVEEMRELAGPLNLKVGIGIGDRSSDNRGIEDADILVCTSEKFDSLMRNRPNFLTRVSIVIADEIHLVNEPGRGPTMEINLARILHEKPDAQIVALSATVGNAEEVAKWLNAELVTSEWRPVPLQYATLSDLQVEVRREVTGDEKESEIPPPRKLDGPKTQPLWAVLQDTVSQGGQLLCFVGTRKSSEAVARDLAKKMKKQAGKDGDEKSLKIWEALSEKSRVGSEGSRTGDNLADCLKGGVAFHHAGLTSKQRKLIEEAFKRGDLKSLSATPTLAAGVNLPARRVLVRDLRRWDGDGSNLLSRMEIQQMLGRAGRPKYDPYGEAWIKCKNKLEADDLSDYYFDSNPESVISKLHMESPMRMHVLSAIATGGQTNRHTLGEFFSKTFLARDLTREKLADNIDGIVDWLCDHDMVERMGVDDKLSAELENHRSAKIDEGLPKKMSEEETWDDSLPPWASVAMETLGEPLMEKFEPPQKKRKGPAVLGFQSARNIVQSTQFEPVLPEDEAMTYRATPFGERVSRLYLDPVSGHILRTGLRKATKIFAGMDDVSTLSPYSFLHLVSTTPDFMLMWPRQAEMGHLQSRRSAGEKHELVSRSELSACRLDNDPLAHVKCASALESWTEEMSSREIESLLGVAPGDLRLRIELCDWLLYSGKEIVRHDDFDASFDQTKIQLMDILEETRRRVMNGCKADLLELVAIRGVGRIRARRLAGFGIRSVDDVLELTERDRQKLADARGWSLKMVDGIIEQAAKARGHKRRR